MSGSADELLSKADALLARWRGGALQPEPPADYPLLTDVVETPPAAVPRQAQRQPAPEQIGIIEERVRRVLEAIEPEVAGILAGCLHGRLEDAAKRLAAEITGQVSDDIAELLREAVHQALEREIGRLREKD
ncbi:MAG: hypothetical protein HYY28_07940 [Betaproteobacteria bacterium]|nr:hypothetical protein [Betaproteobacteria bacterium]MBI2960227.1 hypothetical protein [Betaproteobacteria bacterium]